MNVKVIGLIVVVLIGIIGIGIIGGDNSSTDGEVTANLNKNSQGSDVNQIELIEAADFECPACASFYPILNQVKEEYSDRIEFTFKHFPLTAIHPNAFAAHRASQAAANQGKFWEMHDLLFEQRGLWVTQSTSDPIDQFDAFAEQIGLDIEQYKADFASSEVNDYINNDIEEMRQLGAEATPTFFLNGERVLNSDLDSPAKFAAVLDEALIEAGVEAEQEIDAQPDTAEARSEDSESGDDEQ